MARRTRPSRYTKGQRRRTADEDARRREASRIRSQQRRDRLSQGKKASNARRAKERRVEFEQRSQAERKRFLTAVRKQGPIIKGSVKFVEGRWTALVYVKGAGGVSRPKRFQGSLVT